MILERQSRPFLFALAILLVLIVWFVDLISGPQLSVSIFYLAPIGFAAWYLGPWHGAFISLISAAAWLASDLSDTPGYTQLFIPYWNGTVRLVGFFLLSYLTTTIKVTRQRQEEMTSFIVHDLRSPLASMLISYQLLEEADAAEGQVSRDRQMALDFGLKSAYHMQSLIDSLLDLDRLEAGQMPVQRHTMPIHELIDQALEQVTLIAGQHQISLKVDDTTNRARVSIDPELTVRVLVNLLTNAINFSPSDSTIVMDVRPEEPDCYLFRISDQGPGIPREWRQEAFRKFGQVHARKSGIPVGSGLGLTFCKMAVEAQGGDIWIEEGERGGTDVCLTLPGVG
jgi:signal transduction histidine kinase